jgi:TonB family protein
VQGRRAKGQRAFVSVAVAVLVISGIVTATPNQNTQSESKSEVSPAKLPRAAVDVQLIGSKEDADSGPYLRSVYLSVKRAFYSDLPDSFVKGERAVVVVRLQIQRDGTLSEKSPMIVSSSGKKDMDEAALRAIRVPLPFGPLPEAYPKPNIELQFRFFYNTSPQERAQ